MGLVKRVCISVIILFFSPLPFSNWTDTSWGNKSIDSNDNESNILYLLDMLKSQGFNLIEMYDPVDYLLNKRIKRKCNEHNIDLLVHESPHFLNTNEDLEDFFKESKKKFFQTSFYKSERKKRNILIDSDGRPEGGEWTYDILNRKKYLYFIYLQYVH